MGKIRAAIGGGYEQPGRDNKERAWDRLGEREEPLGPGLLGQGSIFCFSLELIGFSTALPKGKLPLHT